MTMFLNFTSAVVADGAVFGRKRTYVVSRQFENREFMSVGFRRSHTICDCFEENKWKSFTSWGKDD